MWNTTFGNCYNTRNLKQRRKPTRIPAGRKSDSKHFQTKTQFPICRLHVVYKITLLVGRQEEHPACKKIWVMRLSVVCVVVCLEPGADCLHMVHASFKSRLVLPFWYWLTPVVLEKRTLNGCSTTLITITTTWWKNFGERLQRSRCPQ